MEPKGNLIELSMFLKYGLTEVKKTIINVRLSSKNVITLHLTFLKRT